MGASKSAKWGPLPRRRSEPYGRMPQPLLWRTGPSHAAPPSADPSSPSASTIAHAPRTWPAHTCTRDQAASILGAAVPACPACHSQTAPPLALVREVEAVQAEEDGLVTDCVTKHVRRALVLLHGAAAYKGRGGRRRATRTRDPFPTVQGNIDTDPEIEHGACQEVCILIWDGCLRCQVHTGWGLLLEELWGEPVQLLGCPPSRAGQAASLTVQHGLPQLLGRAHGEVSVHLLYTDYNRERGRWSDMPHHQITGFPCRRAPQITPGFCTPLKPSHRPPHACPFGIRWK